MSLFSLDLCYNIIIKRVNHESSVDKTNITEEQIYKEFLRLGMEQLIAQDLSKRYYHNELTYRDLENLEKQFGIKFENLDFKIDILKNELKMLRLIM